MKRVINPDTGLGPVKEEFVDTIIRLTSSYLALREKNHWATATQSLLIQRAAREAGWEIKNSSAVANLIEHVARISRFSTPLARESNWNSTLTVAALKEWV